MPAQSLKSSTFTIKGQTLYSIDFENPIAFGALGRYFSARVMTRTSIEKAAKGLVVILFLLFVWYTIGVLRMMGAA